jgi:integrase/recombinase XerD
VLASEEVMSFARFIQERQYLSNVSPATLEWYKHSFKWLHSESPSQDDLKDAVLRMRAKGLKATGCNSAIRAINAYLRWTGSALKVPQLKEPQLILPTFTAQQVRLLVNWKPQGFHERRLHLLVLFLLDTGCRISEVLGLRVRDIDLDNLLVTLDGKGRKQRIVPISLELRRALFRYCAEYERKTDLLLLVSRADTKLGRRNVLRSVRLLCKRLGFDPPGRTLHSFRHTFAVGYLRRGGNVFALQRVMGHSDLETTKRYVNMTLEDLQEAHERVSLLHVPR